MSLAHGGDLSERVIGLAIEVHRHLGPGLLESIYEECLCFELAQCGIPHRRQFLCRSCIRLRAIAANPSRGD